MGSGGVTTDRAASAASRKKVRFSSHGPKESRRTKSGCSAPVDAAGVEVSLDADVELTLLRLVHPGPVDVRVTARAAASLRD